MKNSKLSPSDILIALFTLMLVGALVLIFWQTQTYKQQVSKPVVYQPKNQTQVKKQLTITALGKKLDLTNAPYKDITYARTSVNIDDTDRYVIAIYSRDLNKRLVADAEKNSDGTIIYTQSYNKYSANKAVYAYYYDAPETPAYPEIIDGVASNIINPALRTSKSKFYVGSMGPAVPSTDALSAENNLFLDWVVKNLK